MIASNQGSPGRDVTFTLKAKYAPSSKTAFKQLADDSTKAQAAAAVTAQRISEQSWKETMKAAERRLSATLKGQQEELKALEELAKARNRSTKEIAAAHSQQYAGQQSVIEGSKKIAEGVVSVARAYILANAANEKDLEVSLKKLAAFESMISAGKGVVNILQGISKGYQAYAATAKAAAVAEAAVAAARNASYFASSTKGIASMAARTGGAVVSGGIEALGLGRVLTVGAVGAAAKVTALVGTLKYLQEVATGTTSNVGSMTNALADFTVKGLNWATKLIGFDWLGDKKSERIGKAAEQLKFRTGQREAEAGAQWEFMNSRFSDRLNSGIDLAGLDAANGAGGTGRAADLASSRARSNFGWDVLDTVRNNSLRMHQQERQSWQSGDTGPTAAAIKGADQQHMMALERFIELRKEEKRAIIEAGREELQTTKQIIEKYEDQLKKQRELTREIHGRLSDAKTRFGDASPLQQERLIQIQRKVRAGKLLDREETEQARSLGLESLDEGARRSSHARADQMGFSKYFGKEEREKQASSVAAERAIEINLRDQRPIVVSLEADINRQALEISRQVARLLEERNEVIARQTMGALDSLVSKAIEKFRNENNRHQNIRDGGG